MRKPKPKAGEELIFVDKKVVGELRRGIFVQKCTMRHVYRQTNAKGIDANVFRRLLGRCRQWRLEFQDTKQVLSIPFEKIGEVATLTDTGAGPQYLVKLSDFNEDQVILQTKLF